MRRWAMSAFVTCFLVGWLTLAAYAVPIVIVTTPLAPMPPPFGGTVIDFEGFAEGTPIDSQYPGVTFGQDVGGRPMIDNKSFLFAYESISGVAVLTGSTEGGDPVPTIAGLKITFDTAVSRVVAFLSDTAPLGDYPMEARDAGGALVEAFVIPGALFPTVATPGCDPASPFDGTGCGIWAGFDVGAPVIKSMQWGRSTASFDAFSIDDVHYEGIAVPEPGSLLLLATGLMGLAARRRLIGAIA